MKIISMMCLVLLLTGATSLKAQGVFDKIDKALSKVDKASNTADKTKGTGDKLLGFFSKKQKSGDSAKAENTTLITISGIDFADLKMLSENIQKCKGVESAKIKYNTVSSTVQVQHAGTSEELLKLIQKSDSKTIFEDKNLEGLEDGQIAIKLPKKK